MTNALEPDRERTEQSGVWALACSLRRAGFRSQRETLAFLSLTLFGWLLAWSVLRGFFGSSPQVLGLSVLLSAVLTVTGGLIWIVWGRDAFPLTDDPSDSVQPYGGPGSPFRSLRELLMLVVGIGVVTGVNNSIAESSRSIVISVFVPLGIMLTFLLIWQVWHNWGRRHFPLNRVTRQGVASPAVTVPIRMESAAGKLIFWSCMVTNLVLLYLVQWLDWPARVALPSYLAMMGFGFWILLVMLRPLKPSATDESSHPEQVSQEPS